MISDRRFVGEMDELYESSLEVLRSVQLPNGGCLATPPGKRYPYVYPRDCAFAIMAFSAAGEFARAKKGLTFFFRTQPKSGVLCQRYSKTGRNASYKPMQLDGNGLVLFALADYVRRSGDKKFLEKNWRRVVAISKAIDRYYDNKRRLILNCNSIHEFPPMERGYEIWTNSVCCAGLREVGIMAKDKPGSARMLELSRGLRRGITEHMWSERRGSFIKTIRVNESSSVVTDADSSECAVYLFDVLPAKSSRCVSTAERVRKSLWNKDLGGICRYEKHWGRNNGGWGPWPLCTLVLALGYIRRGKKKEAKKLFQWVGKISWGGHLAEHYATTTEFEEFVDDYKRAGIFRHDRLVLLNNIKKHPMFVEKKIAPSSIPLAWSHAMFILAWREYKERFL